MREFTFRAVLLGIVISIALAAANAYVGLKVGMSVNASIPAAVMAMLLFRTRRRGGTLLESNMVQTVGSTGQSLTAGMIFTIPALFLLGEDPTLLDMSIWGAIGGLLGICFMVPLRRVLIVREHGVLVYPEGVACAAVLHSGERGGSGAKAVIHGAIVGGGFRLLTGLGLFPETASTPIASTMKLQASLSAEPALLGLGYVIGMRVAAVMLSGALLAAWVVVPAIGFFGAGAVDPVPPAAAKTIAAMSPAEIHSAYIKYIGAGAVTVGGLISLLRSVPTIVSSLWHVAVGVTAVGSRSRDRAERDLPMFMLLAILGALASAMWLLPQIRVNHVGAVAVIVFGFFFVTVAARIVGIVGSSSNPASGMTIAALLGTAVAFRFLTGEAIANPMAVKVACLSVGAVVCSAICISGDVAQDLKTGYLVGATPWKQQLGEIVGVLASVVAIAGVILLLGKTQGFAPSPEHPYPLPAPQANIMRMLVDGVLDGNLPWTLIIIGGAMAMIVELVGLPSLPFAVGFYLPMALSMPIMAGGLVRGVVERQVRRKTGDDDPGILTASGLVAGNGLMGIALVIVTAMIGWWWHDPRWIEPLSGREVPISPSQFAPWLWSRFATIPPRWGLGEAWWNGLAVGPFLVVVGWLARTARRSTQSIA